MRRSRRSLFAAPRALPDWLRSVWATFSLKPPETLLDVDLPAPSAFASPLLPRLLRDVAGVHLCNGCGACVRVCPSRCLEVDAREEGGPSSITRFELSAGACIGCRLCVESCPEQALEMAVGGRVEIGRRAGRAIPSDLLAAGE